jgi:phosphate transport system permease protein
MLFATPIAIFAAIYASQFMTPAWKSRIKPVIEMMASLPSVVLGFIAGLILAPLIESGVMIFITSLFTIPVTLLTGAFLWQFWPPELRGRVSNWRFPVVLVVALPLGILFGWSIAKPTESLLFDGDFFAWLNGRGASGWGGWVLALFPLSAMVSALMISRFINPWIRQRSRKWNHWTTVFTAFSLFIAGFFLAGAISTAAAMFLDALRWETRSGIFGTYIQRNTMIVAIGMSFAIIPLIFTIADDALSSVPDHLRSGSLSTGATPWQTTVRILLPTAASGLFSAVMIGLGRAVGETMIVLMAAGNTPIMDWDIFSGFQTLSATIATELPEATQGSTHYRILFLAAVLLFVLTFFINTVAEVVRQRFRRRAHEL